MALIHAATLSPSKLEMLAAWLPSQQWFDGPASSEVEIKGAFRFDDPAGAVGVETFIVSSGGRVFQVPLTYRGNALAGGEGSLVTTMEHSVLGTRWVYDAVGDPVYAQALTTAIITGGTQADLTFDYSAPPEKLEVTTRVAGTGNGASPAPLVDHVTVSLVGTTSTIATDGFQIEVFRLPATAIEQSGRQHLTGTWPGQADPLLLAAALPN
ncbi:CG0192-related protein [Rhodococcoides kyotonense]|uniref:Maltokinase N-terminal cap domain-containing protein n=1 Tax=Rhodococcoides kyotonense TaxID=398843 RepID=A0A239MDL9_9NOCA|nr:hypothetical protein [Rhodococcus kyotonensis]SNT40263.1 hypothetical protein SAMN05421642_11753 [Rhodococcus kyotonensis]